MLNMSDIGLRPSFVDSLPMSPEEVRELLTTRIRESCADCDCKSFSGYIALRIPENQRRFYSPRLLLSLEPDDLEGTRVTGTFGPNANMWSAFLYGYLATSSVALFSGILGSCQWKIGITPWGLWIFTPTALALVALYLAGRIGRTLGEKQTNQLRSIYQHATGHEIDLR
jgi:hypothetical protein